jgi:hypothetical protein
MTLAAVENPPQSVEHVDSWTQVVGQVAKLADYIAATEFVPEALRDNPAAVAATILYGREVGLPPMAALTQVYVIKGRPGMHAEAMRALVLQAGHDIDVVESTGAVCTMRGRRAERRREGHASEWGSPVTWNLDMARAAGLLPAKAGSGWLSYPRAMLVARCTAELCRRDFPDVIHGLMAVEEVDDRAVEAQAERRAARRTPVKRAASGPAPSPMPVEVPAVVGSVRRPPVSAPDLPPPPMPGQPGPEPVDPDPVPAPVPDDKAQRAEAADVPHEEPLTNEQRVAIMAQFTRLGVTKRDDRIDMTRIIVRRDVDSTKALNKREGSRLLDVLSRCAAGPDLDRLVAALLDGEDVLPFNEAP